MPCNCSGVTNSCMLADGSSSQEFCNCTQGYTGSSCEVKFIILEFNCCNIFGF